MEKSVSSETEKKRMWAGLGDIVEEGFRLDINAASVVHSDLSDMVILISNRLDLASNTLWGYGNALISTNDIQQLAAVTRTQGALKWGESIFRNLHCGVGNVL